ncbi:DNA topoisomerase IV subunit A [Treponema parvum]|uniref:DNA topoisomerase IV subunit A n=1 Tax=Treponema parvum TaxID=138851 RepID=A0A975F547_9SPIR|nr:DNA topoisomerase IV subunit A [Treponema parvum]QTQ14617.1 DNA topoisomerase IV subunit A [Treponema parvum]
MAFVKNIFDENFIQYASYVIRDRAIPDLVDGLKPVQRRIVHTLFEVDDGRYHKVANVVGQCMKYHPHGDASIYTALVNLANKELFIDKQGNFGNMYTGDSASAPRYIECRLRPIARDILYSPKITQFVPSYDGRSQEPVVFRAKLPLVLIMGTEGIAVGMSTKILSHNIREVIDAEKKCLLGKKFRLYPDFPTGALMDVSDYRDGNGKIVMRAKMDTTDEKKISITEIPCGCTTESVMNSIENAVKSGKVKIASIHDYTAESVNIEIKLPRGVYTKDVVDALYAFTECEQSISCNLLVIRDNMPVVMSVSEVIEYHAKQLTGILHDELKVERAEMIDRLHARTLERIFVEERIYKRIETMKTAETVEKAVIDGFKPFKAELIREVTHDDVDRLLKIPIRRISLYDINKNREEVKTIKERIKEIDRLLKNLTEYAVSYLDGILAKLDEKAVKRRTEVTSIDMVDVKSVVQRNIPLRYDAKTGYLGTDVSGGEEKLLVTPYDRVLFVRGSGIYTVMEVPQKTFVGPKMWFCSLADKETLGAVLFTVLYRDPKTKYLFIKRCRISAYIMNRDYFFAPDGTEVIHIDTRKNFSFTVHFTAKPRVKILEKRCKASDYAEKGLKALGVRIEAREVDSVDVEAAKGEP